MATATPIANTVAELWVMARYLRPLWGEFVHVVTVDQLNLPRPGVEGGQRQLVLVEPSPRLAHFMTVTVSERAEDIQGGRVHRTEDNFLELASDARIASFGNQHDTVSIHANATERSFAVHGWQTLERKAGRLRRPDHARRPQRAPQPRTG